MWMKAVVLVVGLGLFLGAAAEAGADASKDIAAKSYEPLRQYLESLPIIDTHDHTNVPGPRYTDPVQVVLGGYFRQDIAKLSSNEKVDWLTNPEVPLEERWPLLEQLWKSARFTGFGRISAMVLREFYGESELTLPALQRMRDRLPDLSNPDTSDALLAKANIVCRLINPVSTQYRPTVKPVLDGTYKLSPRGRLVLRLPHYHHVTCQKDIDDNLAPLNRSAKTLDEYLAGCREIFTAFKRFGAVAAKDQSAYDRPLDYTNPKREDAEKIFSQITEDPRRQLDYPAGIQPLDDWLFHQFIDIARDLEFPVQIHTGMLGGAWRDIRDVNAAHLIPLLQAHPDVRFDLFHLNWPYAGELLFLAKNYPNVVINFCWAHALDPIFCQRFLEEALTIIPHVKLHGFGADYVGFADRAWAQASLARDNIAIALSNLIDLEYLGMDDAKEIAAAILFDNPNTFYRLGLPKRV